MRFPLRLTAELGVALAAKAFLHSNGRSLVALLNPAELPNILSGRARSNAPVLWIAGSDPLLQPEIARSTRELLRAGRYVFLRTEGALLRRRVHEFQPVPRFFFAIDCKQPGDPFAKEAIRIARLSGFCTCVHTEICAGAEFAGLTRLQDYVQDLCADGWIVSTSTAAGSVESSALQRNAAQARKLIPSRRWRIFSEFVDVAIHTRVQGASAGEEALPTVPLSDGCEESAGAQ